MFILGLPSSLCQSPCETSRLRLEKHPSCTLAVGTVPLPQPLLALLKSADNAITFVLVQDEDKASPHPPLTIKSTTVTAVETFRVLGTTIFKR